METVLRFKRESARVSFPGKKLDEGLVRRKMLAQAKREPGSIRMLLDGKGKAAGCLWMGTRRTHTGTKGAIEHIFISRECRRKGLATMLAREAEAYFRKKGIRLVSSTVTITNRPSLALFRKLGYKEKRVILEKKIG
jgi:ribosomal protein S18 acetylase RimI-like enzyme